MLNGTEVNSPLGQSEVLAKFDVFKNRLHAIGTEVGILVATAALIVPQSVATLDKESATVTEGLARLDVSMCEADSALDGVEAESGQEAYSYKFLSSPDLLNADIANTKKSPLYGPGDPNSTNPSYERALKRVFGQFKSEGVTDVAVAGDLVNGHWGMDIAKTGIFGPTDTFKHKKKAVGRAAKLYYTQWMDRFTKYGLTPRVAIGDHEIGDDPWRGQGGGQTAEQNNFKQDTIPYWKDLFGKYIVKSQKTGRSYPSRPKGPASDTAYSVSLHPEVELISLDVFKQTHNDVEAKVDSQQMKWLKGLLSQLKKEDVDNVFVQYHTPIIGPVRTAGSSGLMYKGGTNSELWKVLQDGDVDMILNGEVHAITAHQPSKGDPVQISHGGLFQYGLTNYANICVTEKGISFESVEFKAKVGAKKKVWQTDTSIKIPAGVTYGGTYKAGELILTNDGEIVSRTGMLDVYRGKP